MGLGPPLSKNGKLMGRPPNSEYRRELDVVMMLFEGQSVGVFHEIEMPLPAKQNKSTTGMKRCQSCGHWAKAVIKVLIDGDEIRVCDVCNLRRKATEFLRQLDQKNPGLS
jgi:hypothetical protein